MNKKILCVLILALCVSVFLSADDSIWENRSTPQLALSAYNHYKRAYEASVNYDSAWKFARAAHYYASVILTDSDKEQKKQIFTEGKDAAAKARELNPAGVEGHYYFSICLGSWGEANGIMASLFAVKDMMEAAERAIAIDPSFEKASPLMTRGRIYQKAPGRPLSLGDKKKAEEDYLRAIQLGPNNRVLYRFFAEFLLESKDKTRAADIIRRGLALPFDVGNTPQENLEINLLKELQAKAK